MCGIFGYRSNKFQTGDFLSLMKHRGPDYQAYKEFDNWIFGHLRLSIIDLSSSANQPFEKEGASIVFNGEIFNYLELQSQYLQDEIMSTTSDTEVLLTLLIKYGIKILNLLNGMFSFAFKDKRGTIYLVRDRFGIKPLYYSRIESDFAFSSEIKPLLNLQKEKEIDDEIVKTYFSETATDYDSRSGYKNIYSLKAGHYLKINSSKEQIVPWYKNRKVICYQEPISITDKFERILLDAIKIRCRADVPLAITLSGGIDSTVIYSLIKEKTLLNIKPFIFKHSSEGTDESNLAINLCKKYKDDPIIIEDRSSKLNDLILSLKHLEFPIWSASSAGFFLMYKKISEYGYKVVIEGHGSDEQLGGYPYMIESAIYESIKSFKFLRTKDLINIFFQTLNPNLGENTNLIMKLKFILKTIIKSIKYKKDFQDELDYAFTYRILPIVLRTFDRMAMANSVESRMPFLDYRVVEFIKNIPSEKKINKIGSKSILRSILLKYGNNEIALNRQKMGFANDLAKFLNQDDVFNFISDQVDNFDYSSLEIEKKRAISILNYENLNWKNSSKVWKVAALSYYINELKIPKFNNSYL